jgi:hypothetical protein
MIELDVRKIEETVETTDDVAYVITFVVTRASGIAAEVFVIGVDDAAFWHVATPRDMALYGTSDREAKSKGHPAYRVDRIRVEHEDRGTAVDHASVVEQRLAALAQDWNRHSAGSFGGDVTLNLEAVDSARLL